MKAMNAVERDMPKSEVAWVNVIASRCKCGATQSFHPVDESKVVEAPWRRGV